MRHLPDWVHQTYDLIWPLRFLIPRTGHRLRGSERYRPFFIIGSGRSGNTLMRRILRAHPELHIPPETYVLGELIKLFRRHAKEPWPILVRLVLSTLEYYPEFETFGVSLRRLAQHVSGWPPEKRTLASLIDGFYRFHAGETGKEAIRWGDKTPLNTFALDRIDKVFPDAQYIHMIRDGVDVAVSYVEAGIYDDVSVAAYRWKESLRLAQSFGAMHPERYTEVRYEMLVNTPEDCVHDVTKFLGVHYYSYMSVPRREHEIEDDITMRSHHANVMNPISASNIGKGRERLHMLDAKRIAPILNPQLERLGYSRLPK